MYQVRMELNNKLPVEQFFDSKESRDAFVNSFERDMRNQGIILEKYLEHPVFVSFRLIKAGNKIGDITFYH
ncbi:hypothetical protein P7E02_12460 [Enterococcus hulanensis]|uniref:hypothetical protein n=1 Tax=Enterococcus hulanensis TaxID=2559929 RepID=UPI00288F9000|nr:hypothetical protein [Enterococcus hulanensis]MDT2660687.1 hypothetical protein [Enterococcus hulanensis]